MSHLSLHSPDHASMIPEAMPKPGTYDEPLDPKTCEFKLQGTFIYADNIPKYQLSERFTRSGKPMKLSIRRLMASESTIPPAQIKYDDEGTMYHMQVIQMFGELVKFGGREMRGHRASTLGFVALETGTTILGTKFTKFWQLTRNRGRDSLRPENETRLQRHGYQPDTEWDQKLLFVVKKGVWEDDMGKEFAKDRGMDFQIREGAISVDERWKRDLLLSCWIWRMWILEGLRLEEGADRVL